MLPTFDDYDAILRGDRTVIDVRSPAEFAKGSLPNSINLPILTDDQRHEVGLCYKQEGPSAARALGFTLVSGACRQSRIDSWKAHVYSTPDVLITCWRGGARSQIAQQWLIDANTPLQRATGGFKAIRERSLDILTKTSSRPWVVIGGKTGVGKTDFLNTYTHAIDLEGLANHRGSAFGRLETPQPTPISFELRLAGQLLKHPHDQTLLIEDESRTIGRLAVPKELFDAMNQAPVIVLEAPKEARLHYTYRTYVATSHPEQLQSALKRIQKRLGGERYRTVLRQLSNALQTGNEVDHWDWINTLLTEYYDPMYQFQLTKKVHRIEFKGSQQAVQQYLIEKYGLVPTTTSSKPSPETVPV